MTDNTTVITLNESEAMKEHFNNNKNDSNESNRKMTENSTPVITTCNTSNESKATNEDSSHNTNESNEMENAVTESSLTKSLEMSNPWGSTTSTPNTTNNLSFIMAEQQDEKQQFEQRVQTTAAATTKTTTTSKEEEEMIQLAIQASLLIDTKNEEDEQLKRAIQSSLTNNENAASTSKYASKEITTTNSSYKEPPEEEEVDYKCNHKNIETKQDNSENEKKPAAAVATTVAATNSDSGNLTKQEELEIQNALREADELDLAASIKLAMDLQTQEEEEAERRRRQATLQQKPAQKPHTNIGHVRTVPREEFKTLANTSTAQQPAATRKLWGEGDYQEHQCHYYHHDADNTEDQHTSSTTGYRINSQSAQSSWSKLTSDTIIGPNQQVRTKHDVELKQFSNAERLLNNDCTIRVSDVAYNSFHQSLKQKRKKGVAAHGHGRAENMNFSQTRDNMDGNVRILIQKAINNGLIQCCNGIVKEGKEAIVYHANGTITTNNSDDDGNEKQSFKENEEAIVSNDSGTKTIKKMTSDNYDVAVKVFKQIQEFKTRGMYVDGDSRYNTKFQKLGKREQLELWTLKEYRNLLRANNAGVPVPTPLFSKKNVLFMRFLGVGGIVDNTNDDDNDDSRWTPAPQLKEIEIRKGSKKWTLLYCQILVAMRKLYQSADLVHGDISEYNILVCPVSQVENILISDGDGDREDNDNSLQAVLIDFAQAVDVKHPSALEYLRRDLMHVRDFFIKHGIATLSQNESEQFILRDNYDGEDTATTANDDERESDFNNVTKIIDDEKIKKNDDEFCNKTVKWDFPATVDTLDGGNIDEKELNDLKVERELHRIADIGSKNRSDEPGIFEWLGNKLITSGLKISGEISKSNTEP